MKLQIENLDYGYAKRIIGRALNFSVDAGEILCVLGPNGSGKTTLFRTLLGLLPTHGGRIVLERKSLVDWPRNRLAKAIGYVPQAHAAYFAFSVREIVLMGRTAHIGLFSLPSDSDKRAADDALMTLGIAQLADKPYTEISGGERQLTLIARALAQGSQLLIMDEPTASLDFGNQLRVLRQLATLAATGIGIVFSTHDPDHALNYADRVLMLKNGELLQCGRPDEVVTGENLQQLYGVKVAVESVTESNPGHTRRRRTCVPLSN